jgi:hypothetical protein
LLDAGYSQTCKVVASTQYHCEASLSCQDLTVFEDDARAHPQCGQSYADYAAACGHNADPPAECVNFCTQGEICQPDFVPAGCTDYCNVNIGAFTAAFGSICQESLLDLYACYGDLNCTDLGTLLIDGFVPLACEDQSFRFDSDCQ